MTYRTPYSATGFPPVWIDTHAHLDAPELAHLPALHRHIRQQGVALCVLPAVEASNWHAVQTLAHAHGDAYALGIHPLYVPQADEADLDRLDAELTRCAGDARLVAVGEIGLDFFVSALCTPAMRERQQFFYRAQLRLAKKHRLPVLLHVRKSADLLLKHLREVWGLAAGQALPEGCAGIAHAFNGSDAQAAAFVALGFRLGFGGAVTFDAALRLRHLVASLPAHALVLETDAPDMPPHWLYTTAQQREAGAAQGRNSPEQIPAIAHVVAQLRNVSLVDVAQATTRNACAAFPRLAALLV